LLCTSINVDKIDTILENMSPMDQEFLINNVSTYMKIKGNYDNLLEVEKNIPENLTFVNNYINLRNDNNNGEAKSLIEELLKKNHFILNNSTQLDKRYFKNVIAGLEEFKKITN
jgi:hypothetical protein